MMQPVFATSSSFIGGSANSSSCGTVMCLCNVLLSGVEPGRTFCQTSWSSLNMQLQNSIYQWEIDDSCTAPVYPLGKRGFPLNAWFCPATAQFQAIASWFMVQCLQALVYCKPSHFYRSSRFNPKESTSFWTRGNKKNKKLNPTIFQG